MSRRHILWVQNIIRGEAQVCLPEWHENLVCHAIKVQPTPIHMHVECAALQKQ